MFVPVTVMFLAEISPEAKVPQVFPELAALPVMTTLPAFAVTAPEKLMAEPVLDCPDRTTLPAVATSAPLPE